MQYLHGRPIFTFFSDSCPFFRIDSDLQVTACAATPRRGRHEGLPMHGFETMSVGRAAPRNGLREILVRWRERGEVRDELRMLLVGWGLFESAGGALRPTEAGRVLAQLVW